ncbi:MAG: alpha/beta hydrolase [Bacteroidetes bacterium]|nr:alpha/beta hydrolase [Bacteroidota bacterium]
MKFLHLVVFVFAVSAVRAQAPAAPPAGFKHANATVNGVNIHYVIGGTGEPLVLVHGFGQNWYMWNRVMPELAKHFTVITPDLRGLGESGKPAGGYDKKTMATDIYQLTKKLGYSKINLAGHDIGMMVVYAYAAQYPSEVKKLALLDALIPGVEPSWSTYWAKAWWWGFFGWEPSGQIVEGKMNVFLTNFWPMVGYKKNAFTAAESAEFIRSFSVAGATSGSFHWFGAFPQEAKDNAEYMKHKLTMPLLTVGGDHSTASFLGDIGRKLATKVTEVKVSNAGHWMLQENPAEVQAALLSFFTAK